jgi:hypothetical protein
VTLHRGGCHCDEVAFEVEAPPEFTVQECNCSICSMTGFLHLFCRRCGIKSVCVPRSNPDGYSVNARCLDPSKIGELVVEPFVGRHWETRPRRRRD